MKKVVKSLEVSLSRSRWVRGWRRVLKKVIMEAKAATYEEEVRDLRGVRWVYPRWITTRMYS